MDPEKFAKIQVQMKQNQQEYGDFLQDLDSWGQEMKEKDTALKSQGSNKVTNDLVVSTKSRSVFYWIILTKYLEEIPLKIGQVWSV